MASHDSSTVTPSFSNLKLVQQLAPPPVPETTTNGEYEDARYWEAHEGLIRNAWHEWDALQSQQGHDQLRSTKTANNNTSNLLLAVDEFIEPRLKKLIEKAWESPTHEIEQEIRSDLLEEIIPDEAYQFQLFRPDQILRLRQVLDSLRTSKSGIPTRRPNGMNRFGLVLDADTPGGIAAPSVIRFQKTIVDRYVRPLARSLFPHFAGIDEESGDDDSDIYGFTIRYKVGEDVQLKEHADASLFTININLNIPGVETYDGSSLCFVKPAKDNRNGATKEVVDVSFHPGMAVIHRGQTRHAARPIRSSPTQLSGNGTTLEALDERHNWVIWLFGRYGYVRIVPYPVHERKSVQERWSIPRKETGRQVCIDESQACLAIASGE